MKKVKQKYLLIIMYAYCNVARLDTIYKDAH